MQYVAFMAVFAGVWVVSYQKRVVYGDTGGLVMASAVSLATLAALVTCFFLKS